MHDHELPAGLTRRTALSLFGLAALGGIGVAPAHASELYGPAAADARKGGTLTMGLLLEPPGLDPFHQAADARIRVTVLLYQGLFYEGSDGQAVPLLAESYDLSPDKLAYTVKLRKGVKFHTGQTMTAKDVAYSYNYIRDPKNGSPGAGDFAVIQSVEATDDATVTIKLSQPNAALPMTLGNKYGGVVPAGYFDAADAGTKLNQISVGTGPFKLAEFKPNSNLVLARNPDYWEPGLPYLDQVNFIFLPNSSGMLVGLRNRRIDLAVVARPQDVQQVEGQRGLFVERWPSLNQKALDLGLEYGPLSDERVRQAISLAVDKAEIMRASVGGLGKVIGTMVAGMQDLWGVPIDQLPNQKQDLDKARKLLADAGHPNGLDLNLTTIIGYDWMDPAALALREQLGKIGIKLNIQRIELGVWVKNFQSKQMGLTFNDWSTQPDPNLLFYRHFHMAPEGADFRNWKDELASKLLDEGRAESELAKRKAIYARFQQEMARSVPTVMLFSADHITVRGERVKNYVQHPTGWYYGLARTYLAS
ncbi:ABC transporter substrate-binding protein [Limobrevibacterium gyesilva]|uniref:ABC transporter substrate-binding protein n=1 Tax=Limobrevibacterium gyesilva TaxID=2991712 RepID=A0AA42CD21_9PROT|nr:ABC transporter substrate-binding protein [Limobrevibacterium gyesilva]MCW3474333.1 ABC transporter substrate-binding protein [Limobrevibacterium gyesilva]